MSKKAWVVVIIVIAVIIIGYAVSRKSGETGGVVSESGAIKIGELQALTGDAAVYGESQDKAIQLAVEEINKAGGLNGRMLEVVVEDGKCDPQAGGTSAQKLVSVDKVAVIIGGSCSGETLSAAAITEPSHVVIISGSASSPKVSDAGDYVFRTYPSDALAGKVAATYAYNKLNARKAAVISELTDYSQGLRTVYKDSFTALGGTIVADETYTTGDTDFRTQVLKVKQSAPDTIYVVPQSPTPGITIFKQLRENGVTKPVFQTAEVLLDRSVASANKSQLEGVIGVEAGIDYEHNDKAKVFQTAMKAKFNEEPGVFAGNAYDAVYLIADAIKANDGKVDTNQIRDYLYKVKAWAGVAGSITMDAKGDPLLGLSVRKIVGGAVTDLGPYTP
jgi:branched-chain amino acid transport system substrate-binding protein